MTTLLLFLVVVGIIDFSRAMYVYHAVANSAEAATRYAIVMGKDSFSTTNEADVRKFVKDNLEASNLDRNSVTVTPTWQNDQKQAGTWVRVEVDYDFPFLLPLASITMTSHSQMIISR